MEPFVNIQEAATFLRVRISWLYEQCRFGRVPSYKIGAFRRFRLSELESWARANGRHADPLPPQQGDGAIGSQCQHVGRAGKQWQTPRGLSNVQSDRQPRRPREGGRPSPAS